MLTSLWRFAKFLKFVSQHAQIGGQSKTHTFLCFREKKFWNFVCCNCCHNIFEGISKWFSLCECHLQITHLHDPIGVVMIVWSKTPIHFSQPRAIAQPIGGKWQKLWTGQGAFFAHVQDAKFHQLCFGMFHCIAKSSQQSHASVHWNAKLHHQLQWFSKNCKWSLTVNPCIHGSHSIGFGVGVCFVTHCQKN